MSETINQENDRNQSIFLSNESENKKGILKKYPFKPLRSSEKISLTHLFDFSYSQSFNISQSIYSNYKNTKQQKFKCDYRLKEKEYFINSKYRFIVNPYENYHSQMLDPDIPIPWKNILQILASRLTQHTLCPICLEENLIAPRITKCGHIFCLHCIICYFENENSDKHTKWKKCPICFDAIYIMDLKSLRWYDNISPELPIEGKEILLRLFIRKQGYFSALPYENMSENMNKNDIPWYFEPDIMDYSRIMKASETYMIKEMSHELEQLQKIKDTNETEESLMNKSINKAIEYIEQSILSFEKMSNDHDHLYKTQILHKPEINIKESSQNMLEKLHLENDAPKNLTKSTYINNIQKINSYLFYRPQIITHYYLSILDIKILKMAFGDYTLFPPNIIAKVENISTGHIVDDELRKRIKYLSNLPYGCEISFLECDWSNIIDESILQKFKYEINERRQKKKRKLLKEKIQKKYHFKENKNQTDLYN
ncbi:hypothetical protein PCANB_001426 [Pneumocystis canis]|nr:hypothetical protein PCK1_001596 [Pneumocystis canis]KAG5439127.1 hypothetical protein PCANB_001426 [Pneumocystis canis]